MIPIEKSIFRFLPSGEYNQERQFVFTTPLVPNIEIEELLKTYSNDLAAYRAAEYKLQDKIPRFEIYCHELLVAALNGNATARHYLANYLDGQVDGIVGESCTEAIRLLGRIETR